jgi:hypothetical protein
MTQWVFWWALLLGPIYFVLLVGLYLARHFFREEQILFEISETIAAIAAALIAVAVAGLIVQVI